MSSSACPSRLRPLIVLCLAIGMICSGFSLPLTSAHAAAENFPAGSAPTTCCCGLDGSCGMGCCILQAPAAPQAPVPTAPSNERPPSFSALLCRTGLLNPQPQSVPRAVYSQWAGDLLVETSLQSLQVRLDI